MTGALIFEFPQAWLLGVAAAGLLALGAWRQKARGLGILKSVMLGGLRGVGLLALVFLAARPVWFSKEPPANAARPVMVLMDRSESMSLADQDQTRYRQALGFLRDRLLPALKSANLPVQAMLFDQNAEVADGPKLAATTPNGRRTNLGGAIAQAVSASSQPPLALIALTDGSVNQNEDNTRGLTSLVDARVPFIGVGFGSDQGAHTLTVRNVEAPPTVSTKTSFSISAQLEVMNAQDLPVFDLLLFRDGQLSQKRTINPGKGSRDWLENFSMSEPAEGVHTYTVQLLPPAEPNLKCVSLRADTSVRISDEKELRVLYIQGALTWDYKFINLALRNDPGIKLTGLTRTSKQSVFRQNVETAGELINGFPNSLEELAPFRVVVLSNLRPAELTPAQQDVLARFCGEQGGGVLMIGGASTFDSSWQNSRLEQLLPVVFAGNPGIEGLDRPFRLELTADATQHPVFQIADDRSPSDAWAHLPTFTMYGRVDAAKPGAQVWMVHQSDDGPNGRRILMASQHYGAGLSAVLTVQNFWRWRMAKDSEPQQFDRFWRQLFRYLSESGRQDVSIHLADQDLHPQMDVRVVLEKQPNPKNLTDTSRRFFLRVQDSQKNLIHEEAVELEPLHPAEFTFRAEKPDVYSVSVSDASKAQIASRLVEIRDMDVEFQNTGRDMENLRQWASASDGLAFKVEECPNAKDLVAQIREKIEQVRHGLDTRHPVGIGAWSLALVLGCLSAEWLLRKKWGLV
jgi:uncharacterized membrane protein